MELTIGFNVIQSVITKQIHKKTGEQHEG